MPSTLTEQPIPSHASSMRWLIDVSFLIVALAFMTWLVCTSRRRLGTRWGFAPEEDRELGKRLWISDRLTVTIDGEQVAEGLAIAVHENGLCLRPHPLWVKGVISLRWEELNAASERSWQWGHVERRVWIAHANHLIWLHEELSLFILKGPKYYERIDRSYLWADRPAP